MTDKITGRHPLSYIYLHILPLRGPETHFYTLLKILQQKIKFYLDAPTFANHLPKILGIASVPQLCMYLLCYVGIYPL